MQLIRLEVKGFKSFGDKITINFNDGVTAIAGPNGCGKSNVVDAIRWVLGEQSTKALRSEKMDNIIFNGTKSRKPSQLAEASLTFNNNKGVLPVEFSQVTVTRKLYRNGDSEYRLNDVQCRLKDITDLFLDTGIGNDTYSIIELKMIDEIIANKEGSRRTLFEESSGISKYKLRKKQTLSKLKDTEADLSRVEDLLLEIEKNLKTLENQAKKAERYYKLKEQYQQLSVSLATFRISGFKQSLDNLEQQEQQQSEERNKLVLAIEQLEKEVQELKAGNITKEKNLSVQQKATHEHAAKIRAYENEKKIKNEQLRFLQEKESRVSQELEKDRQQYNHVLYNIKRLSEEQMLEGEKLQTQTADLNTKKTELEEFKLQQQSTRAQLDILTKDGTTLQNQVHKLEKEITVLNIQRDSLNQEINRNQADTELKEVELSQFNTALSDVESRYKTKKEELQAAVEFEEENAQKIKSTESAIQALKEQFAKESRKLDATQNEYNLTKSMVDNLEGFPDSIRFLKKNASWAKQAPLLSDILFCKEEYRIPVENYLEPVMNHYVADTQADAVQAIKLLAGASRGRANFFVLDAIESLPAVNDKPAEDAALVHALSIVEVDKKYQRLCSQLLRNVYIHTGKADTELDKPLPEKGIVILNAEGKFAKSRITVAGGSVGLFEGKRIGRAKNLENLARQIKQLEQSIENITQQTCSEQAVVEQLRALSKKEEVAELRNALNTVNHELISLQTRREQYITFINSSRDRKQDIEQKIASLTTELQAAEPELLTLKDKHLTLSTELEDKKNVYADLSEQVNELATVWNQNNILFHQQQNKLASINKDLDYRETQRDSLEKRLDNNTAELATVKEEIAGTVQHTDLSDVDLNAMYEQKTALEQALQDEEQAYYAERGAINEKENELVSLRNRKEQAEFLHNEIKDKKTGLKMDLNALRERLSVEFDLDINDLLEAPLPEDESEQELKERTEKLKKTIDEYGAVNSMAVEAFREMNERYNFIKGQKNDLLEAKESLLATIREIDDNARSKFMDSFTKVRENFIRVFRSLFNEEDSCDLVLTNPANPLESDIDIIARPKGKRPLSINQLSGGEKTLTATALLFSLYLLKPAPFCIFDEVDAPLDDTNIDKFNNIIRTFSSDSQFIIVSHNKRTLASTDVVYGVTMVEQGISRVVPVDLRELPN